LGRLQGLRVDEVAQPLRLQGQYWDQEIGLSYNRYRYFDPHICSFISQDPIGLAGGENVYAYAPNVWGWVDPLGLCKHGPMNPGPLSDDIANTFRSGTYTARTVDKPTTLYRVISDTGNPAGSYWTSVKPQGPLQSVVDFGLDQNWGNTAARVVEAKIPAGTRIYEGIASAQRGLVGGGNQIYIPKVDPKWIVP